MKKVLHILNSSAYSGAENVVITIINSMKNKYKCSYEFCYTSRIGVIEEKLNSENINHYLIEDLSRCNIKKAIKHLKPDIIHAHDFTASIVTTFSSRNIPIISHLHNNPPWIKKICLKSLIYKISMYRYNRILAVSDSVVSEYIFNKSMKKKCKVIGNPIDISIIQDKANKVETIEDSYDIVFLGRLTEQKNPLRFIKIINEVVKYIPDITCACIGHGDLYQDCERLIKELKLENHIKLLGFIENPYTYLKKSKILCITSEWEGFGLVAAESLALGVPVVTSGVGGLSGIVTERSGKICNNDNEFITEIVNLITSDKYHKEKSREALIRAKEINNIEEYISMLNNVYMKSIGSR